MSEQARFQNIVGDENRRHRAPDVDFLKFRADVIARQGIKCTEGFVKQQHVRLSNERAGKTGTLCHAARQLGRLGTGGNGEPRERENVRKTPVLFVGG